MPKEYKFECDFNQILKVLRCEVPSRPTLFEFFMNSQLYQTTGVKLDGSSHLAWLKCVSQVFRILGYDYVTASGSSFSFPKGGAATRKDTVSLNERSVIYDRESFDRYEWIDADKCDYSQLKDIEPFLAKGQKLMVQGPGGVLENVIALVGFDNLCMMLYDDPELVGDIFERVGDGFVKYYDKSAAYNSVGFCMSNDDWGFNTQPMLSPDDMRKYVFPQHKRIVEAVHRHGKPVVLHSCGNYSCIIDDLLALKYDGRHSYEDNIIPVEDAYEQFNGKIAVLGGIDVNFLITKSVEEIQKRCKDMIERSASRGGYALGSGNSIPEYIPNEKYFAMVDVVRNLR